MLRDLSKFHNSMNARQRAMIALWGTVQNGLLVHSFVPSSARVFTYRIFGADIGNSVFMRRGIRVSYPWNLSIGNNSWIGEDVRFINHEFIKIGNNVCISQEAVICSSGHDFRSASLEYKHHPISIADGSWVCVRALVLPGSVLGSNSVVSAGEIFSGQLADSHIYKNGESQLIEYSE